MDLKLLTDTATNDEITAAIEQNSFLQDIVFETESKHNNLEVIRIINNRIKAWNDSKQLRFDVPKHCKESCEDIYYILIQSPVIEIGAIAKLIAEFAVIASTGCDRCGYTKVFMEALNECIYCQKLICNGCLNYGIYADSKVNFCKDCAVALLRKPTHLHKFEHNL